MPQACEAFRWRPAATHARNKKRVHALAAAQMGAAPASRFQPREKPTYVPQTNDPLGFSLADNLFWNDITSSTSGSEEIALA